MKRNMHVLLLAGWYYPDSVGGTEAYVQMLANDLKGKGINVTIAAPSVDEKEHNYIHDGLPVYRYPVALKPTRDEVMNHIPPRYLDVFKNWLKNNRPDIAHMHSYTRGCGFYHAHSIKQLKIPLVITIHVPGFVCMRGTSMQWGETPCTKTMNENTCVICWMQFHKIPCMLRKMLINIPWWISNIAVNVKNKFGTALSMKRIFIDWKNKMHELFDLADNIIVVSQWLYEVLILNGLPKGKISLSRHGLPTEQINRNGKFKHKVSETIRIGYIGRFFPVKGVHILIQAVKKLPLYCRVELKLYGRVNEEEGKKYFNRLKKLAKADSRIKFCGEVNSKNRDEVFENLDVIAVPSIWLETGPLVVLEAFAKGIPVIGSDLPAINELVVNEKNGILVKVGNIENWRDAFQKLSRQPELIEDLTKGITAVRSIKDVCEEMVKIYKNILRPVRNNEDY